MKILSLLLRASKGSLLLSFVSGLLSGGSGAWLISLINRVLAEEEAQRSGLLLTFVVAGLAALLSRIGAQLLLNRLHHGALFDLRMHLCRQVLAAPLRRLEEAGSPRVMTALVEDAMWVSMGLLHLPTIFINAAVIAGCLLYLAWMSVPLFLAMLGLTALGVVTYYWLPTQRSLSLLNEARTTQETQYKNVQSLLGGSKELKLNGRRRSAFFEEVLVPTAERIRHLFTVSSNLFSVTASWGGFLHILLIGLLLSAAAPLFGVGREVLVGYTLVVLYIQQPMASLMGLLPQLSRGAVSLRKIEELGMFFAEAGAEQGPQGERAQPRTFRRLELDEWAADQEPLFKDVFYRELLPELKRQGKALLVISHDDRYFSTADRLVRLESGQLLPSTEPVQAQRAS